MDPQGGGDGFGSSSGSKKGSSFRRGDVDSFPSMSLGKHSNVSSSMKDLRRVNKGEDRIWTSQRPGEDPEVTRNRPEMWHYKSQKGDF